MSYAGKSEIDEALRPDGVYSHDGVPFRDVVARPAETKRSPEEDKAQNEYADQVEAEANSIGDPEMFRARLGFAGRVRDAIPIAEFYSRRRALNRARDDIPEGLPLLEQAQIRDGYDREIDALGAQNIYNPTLFQIMEAFDRDGKVDPQLYMGPNPDSADAVTRTGVEAANVVLGLNVGKSSVVKRLSIEERVSRAVKAATDPLNAETNRLRSELDEFKAVAAGNGARFQ